jgi:hypothetical protein
MACWSRHRIPDELRNRCLTGSQTRARWRASWEAMLDGLALKKCRLRDAGHTSGCASIPAIRQPIFCSPKGLMRGVRHCRPKLRANAQRHAGCVTCPLSRSSLRALRSPLPACVFPATMRLDRAILVVAPQKYKSECKQQAPHWRTFFLRLDAGQFFPIEGIAWKLISQTA